MEHEERQARQDLIRKRIRTILIETGLSQAAIADMFDIPANVICQYVNKKITPSPTTYRRGRGDGDGEIGGDWMKLDKVANSKNDEFYTPAYAISPILKYIPSRSVVWCPFDQEKSLFVSELRKHGCEVIHTHIADGQDFFDTDIPKCDYIISNPPYSVKGKVFQRLFQIGKSFAMLVGVVGLFESQERFEMFRDNSFEIMYLNRRVAYFKDYAEQKPSLNPPFSSVYVCHGILPEKIIFEEIQNVDKGAIDNG